VPLLRRSPADFAGCASARDQRELALAAGNALAGSPCEVGEADALDRPKRDRADVRRRWTRPPGIASPFLRRRAGGG
jgi:hypothetical protein